MTIPKKWIWIIVAVLVTVLAAGGIALGTYYGVNNNKYCGYVYEKDTDKPMANVAVSNGKDVVLTDNNGYFELDGWMKDSFITVTTPTGYWTEQYYIKADHKGKDYNFYLDKLDKDYTNHSFIQVSDTEVGEGGVGDWVNNIKNIADEQDAAFIIHTGDICYEAGLKSHYSGMNTENMGRPVRYIIGNHDYVKWGDYSEALFESIYGPTHYSFDVGNIHYVVTPIAYGDNTPRYTRDNVWRWLANDLKQVDDNKKVVIFNHDFCPDENGFTVRYGLSKLDLRKEGLLAWVFGHWHYNYMNEVDGVFNITTARPDTGGIDSSLSALREVSFEGNKLVSSELFYYDYKTSGTPEEGAAWTKNLDGRVQFAEPIVDGNRVYVGTVDDGYPKKSKIYCINADNGEIIWQYATANSIRNSMDIDGDRLVAQDIEGKVYCLDKNDGKELWIKDLDLSAPRNTSQNVVIDSGKVYCGGAQHVFCLDLNNGNKIWDKKNKSANGTPARMIIDDNQLIVGSQWDKLVAYDKTKGKELWYNDKDGVRYRSTTPTVKDGYIYVTAENKLFKLDRNTGKAVKFVPFEGYSLDAATSPLIIGDTAYITTVNKGIVAIDINEFRIKWNYATGDNLVFTAPYSGKGSKTVESTIIEKDGILYFGASDGYVHAVRAADGEQVGTFNLNAPVLNSLAFCNDGIIVADFAGNVTRIPLTAFSK